MWDPGHERFDAVVSFNAFQWIDPEIRFAKSASVLRAGGSLGVFGSAFVVHDGADPTWLALGEDHEAVTGAADPRRHVNDLRDRSGDFTAGGYFSNVVRKTYRWDLTYEADAYVALLASMSRYRVLPDDVREELFARFRRRIQERGGTVSPTRADVLYVATTA